MRWPRRVPAALRAAYAQMFPNKRHVARLRDRVEYVTRKDLKGDVIAVGVVCDCCRITHRAASYDALKKIVRFT